MHILVLGRLSGLKRVQFNCEKEPRQELNELSIIEIACSDFFIGKLGIRVQYMIYHKKV
jgi:hypothetical protein